MPELMKKLRTENVVEITFEGPEKNRDLAITTLRKLGFANVTDSVPWREAFFNHDKTKEPGICLAGIRRREGLTQKQLSELTGIPEKHISEMENSKRSIDRNNAKILAKALNVGYKLFLIL